MSGVTNVLPVMTGLAMWFDAADTSTLTLSSTTVTQWKDKSGNNYHATNGSKAAPVYKNTGFNDSYAGILFDGSTTMLQTAPILPTPVLSANGTDSTIFVVLNRKANAPNSVVYGLGVDYNTYVLRDPWASSQNAILDIGTAGRIAVPFTATGNIIYSLGRTGNTSSLFSTGTLIGRNAAATGTVGAKSQTFCIGGGLGDSGWYNSFISEIIIYNVSLTDVQRQTIEGYLACKWGMKANLPAGHPHSLICPVVSLTPSASSTVSTASLPPGLSSGPFTIANYANSVTVGNTTYYLITGNTTLTVNSQVNVAYFAVGGGGGSGSANGGGAGGLQTNVDKISVYPSQYNAGPLVLNPSKTYTINIGNGGDSQKNGGNTIISGADITTVTALGGAYGGSSGQWCPAPSGGCSGGGCTSVGTQGGSSPATATNAGAGIGGSAVNYTTGGPGISYAGVIYGAGAPNSGVLYLGPANSGNGGSNGGMGGSGIVILSVISNTSSPAAPAPSTGGGVTISGVTTSVSSPSPSLPPPPSPPPADAASAASAAASAASAATTAAAAASKAASAATAAAAAAAPKTPTKTPTSTPASTSVLDDSNMKYVYIAAGVIGGGILLYFIYNTFIKGKSSNNDSSESSDNSSSSNSSSD
jgi:hypothetical protein